MINIYSSTRSGICNTCNGKQFHIIAWKLNSEIIKESNATVYDKIVRREL